VATVTLWRNEASMEKNFKACLPRCLPEDNESAGVPHSAVSVQPTDTSTVIHDSKKYLLCAIAHGCWAWETLLYTMSI
jgi:hypothetical protein